MRLSRAGLLAVFIQFLLAATLLAQDVTLKSRDGSVEIVGTLLGYDGEFYRVDSIYGELTLDGSGVICTGPGCPDLNSFVAEIRFSGPAPFGARILPELIRAFAAQEGYLIGTPPGSGATATYLLTDTGSGQVSARFSITESNSDKAVADLLAEEADVAMSLRQVSQKEVDLGITAGLGDFSAARQSRVLALDALVPVVSRSNPVLQISPEDLARIFAGEITNWADLGGVDAPVALHLRAVGSGVLQVFLDRIMVPSGRQVTPGIIRHDTNASLLRAVARDPFAIGLSTLSEQAEIRPLILSGGCGFRAAPTPAALKSDDYPLTAPLFYYVRDRRLPAIGRDFLRFSRSANAQNAILQAGFVDQTISRTPVAQQGDRLANAIRAAGNEVQLPELQRLVAAMDGARRLSVTFRFDGGSSALTAQSRSNIALLARALETGDFGEGELTFVGFSDGNGAPDANRRLSRTRAAAVRDAVRDEATTADQSRVALKIDGFGEALPMACDDTEWGRQINRRVEVWVR